LQVFGFPVLAIAAMAKLRGRCERISDLLLSHIVPLGREHITFNGDHVWPTEPAQ
jgi:hypothetical protein